MKPLPHWLVHTWMGLAGLLGGSLGSWEADGVAAGFGLNPLRWTGCWWFGRQCSRMTRMMDGIYKTHEWKNMFGILQRTGIWSYNLTRAEPSFQGQHQAQAVWAAFIPYLQIAPPVRKANWELTVGFRAWNQEKGASKNSRQVQQHMWTPKETQGFRAAAGWRGKTPHLKEGDQSDRSCAREAVGKQKSPSSSHSPLCGLSGPAASRWEWRPRDRVNSQSQEQSKGPDPRGPTLSMVQPDTGQSVSIKPACRSLFSA